MENEIVYLYLDDVIPNRFQPRENFDEQALKELAVSIKEHGVIQPIVVRKIGDKYEIIAGERRYKASTMAGLTKIPAIIRNLDDKESSKVALIENLQRKDLTPIEEARTYQKILEIDALTQEELAKTMGKSQSAVSNKLRLLSLTDEVQDALLNEKISERHARSLLNVEDKEKQKQLLDKIITTRMTVRELEEEIKNMGSSTDASNDEVSSNDSSSDENNGGTNLIIDPTKVDIEKAKSDSIDINMPDEKFDINKLIDRSLISSQVDEKKSDNAISEGVITTDSNINEDNDLRINDNVIEIKPNDNIIDIKPRDNISAESNIIDSMVNKGNVIENANSISEVVQNSEKPKSMQETVDNVKKSIDSIKNSGIKVDTEEFDFDDFYQIVIRIDKDNF